MEMQDLLEGLNEEQKAAVTHKAGPLMIIAGAGTGKTTVITRRIAWLISQGMASPENILALTFTEKAAAEMEERVDLLLPFGYVDLQISTFHSFCETLLREYGAEIGIAQNFKLTTELDAWLLARKEFDRFELSHYRPRGNPMKYLKGLLTHFSRLKDFVISPDDYLAYAEGLLADRDTLQGDEEQMAEAARVKELADAYHAYQRILHESDSLDFGDLLLLSIELLKKRPKVLAAVRKRFSYVLVDEFQDTNRAQYELVKLIAAPANNLTVVGDDDQSIYKFRGASIENILEFKEDYTDAKEIVLKRNYRSVQAILDASHAFIQMNNPHRLEAREGSEISKKLKSQREDKGEIQHIHEADLDQEITAVANRIGELKEKHPDAVWNDFGVLVRSNDAATPLLAALDRRGIPYQFLALRGLYTKPIILDIVAFLRCIQDPHESASLYRIVSHPLFKISPEAVITLNQFARRKGTSLFGAMQAAAMLQEIPPEEQERIRVLLAKLQSFTRLSREKKPSELFVQVAKDIGFVAYINAQSEREKQEGFSYLQQLYERVKSYEGRHLEQSLRGFLDEFDHELAAGEEGSLSVDMEAGPDMVRIMTVHASKGLEFRFVFVLSLVDRRFPTSRRGDAIPIPDGLLSGTSHDTDAHLQEERRLFYVAMTRAKEGLYLTSAEDYGGARKRKLSRFLTELGFEQPEMSGGAANHPLLTEEPKEVPSPPMVYQLPKQYSFTQLVAFRTCPLQYKFAHLLKIPQFGKWTFSYGKTMHNTLQAYFTSWVERAGGGQATLFDAPENAISGPPVSLEELLGLYEEHWIDDWYQNDKQREEYRKKGKESLESYFALLEKDMPNPLYLEQGFTLKFGDMVLKGRIDRIDACEDGVEIIDYKTGSPKTEKTLDKGDKEQLLLYQLAARDILGLKPVKLTFHYLEDHSKVSFIGKDEELLKLQEEILDRVAAIKKSEFNPKPGFHCKFCDFADICEYRQR